MPQSTGGEGAALQAANAEMNDALHREQLANCHAHWQRIYNRIYFVLALAIAICGAAIWNFTHNLEHLNWGVFLAAFPLLGMLFNHFVLFNARRDPLKTQQRLEELHQKQNRELGK